MQWGSRVRGPSCGVPCWSPRPSTECRLCAFLSFLDEGEFIDPEESPFLYRPWTSPQHSH